LAEYHAISLAIEWAIRHGMFYPPIFTDSQEAVNYMHGKAVIKDPNTRIITQRLKDQLQNCNPTVQWTPRDATPQHTFTDYVSRLGFFGDGTYTTRQQHDALLKSFLTATANRS
jgi:hypothetical protein